MTRGAHEEITIFFRQVVEAVNVALGDVDLREDAAWELARQMHECWRDALRRAFCADVPPATARPKGHPAMEDLLRMIDLEVEP